MLLVVTLALLVALFATPRTIKWIKLRREVRAAGWRLVAWRRMSFGRYELRFQNGTVVRDHYHYPSGHFIGIHFDEQLWDRINVIEKQLEFGQHAELEIKDEA